MANSNPARRTWSQPLQCDVDAIPTGPSPDLPPIESQLPAMQRLIFEVRKLFEVRPIYTRRALMNSLPGNEWDVVGQSTAKYVYQYVGYLWSSGPWRDAVVRFGVDPRQDPECRKYQTMMFMLDRRPKDNGAKESRTMSELVEIRQMPQKESHLFNGKHITTDGKVWQVCDLTDPLLRDLLATTKLRNECHVSFIPIRHHTLVFHVAAKTYPARIRRLVPEWHLG